MAYICSDIRKQRRATNSLLLKSLHLKLGSNFIGDVINIVALLKNCCLLLAPSGLHKCKSQITPVALPRAIVQLNEK